MLASHGRDRRSLAEKRTILFVEDDPDEAEAAVDALRGCGYIVEEATDGGQAVKKAARHSPDVVVTDLRLPILNGIDVVKRIRRNGVEKRPHVIVLSSMEDARSRQLAFEAGCDQYIAKPCPPGELAAAIGVYFAKRDGS